jgi:hypothetical protein
MRRKLICFQKERFLEPTSCNPLFNDFMSVYRTLKANNIWCELRKEVAHVARIPQTSGNPEDWPIEYDEFTWKIIIRDEDEHIACMATQEF